MTETTAQKLLIKPNSTVWLNEPARLPLLTPMPEGVRETSTLATASTAVVFADNTADVRDQLERHRPDLDKPAAFWIAYPVGERAGIDPDSLGPIAADFNMRPCGQVSIGERWSVQRFRTELSDEGRHPGDTE